MAKNSQQFNQTKRLRKLKIYEFQGLSQISNEIVRGQVQAVNENEARRQLRYKNIKITKLKQVRRYRGRIKYKDITVFTRQLTSMIKAGLPITQALTVIVGGVTNQSMAAMVLDIKNEVEQGSSLTGALKRYPKYFDSLYLGLVQSGEASGLLDISLDRIATQREKNTRLINKVRRASMYPVFVILVSITVVTLMLVHVLPIFKGLYDSTGTQLPLITRVVIALSNFLVSKGWLLLIVLILLGFVFYWNYKNSEPFKTRVTRFIMKIPVIGNIIQQAETSRWARTFASLYGSGVPMTETLRLISETTKNIIFKDSTGRMELQVNQGESLVSSMRSMNDVFPTLLVQLVEVGEEAGTLEEMMNNAADYFDEEVDTTVGALETILQPVTIVVLGVIVGFILIAMYLPIFNLASAF